MRFCSHCKTTYPPGLLVCPRDGHKTTAISAEHNEDPNINKFAGSYRVNKKLGEGGMGSVYLAEHPTLKKQAAAKILHPEFAQKTVVVERFFAEAKAVSQLGHPNIVEILDFGTIEGSNLPFILMELLRGESLMSRLRREKFVLPAEAVNLMVQLLSALSSAHQKGIIHRDIKPDNIFLDKRSEGATVKLLDFGIAKLLDDKGVEKGLTQMGTVVGTPQYMSPEQAQGHIKNIDGRSDVYSAGVILFEMLCGQLPFAETSFGDLVLSHVMKEPPAPRSINVNISRALDQIILKALAKKPQDRYQSAEEMAEALRNAPLTSTRFDENFATPEQRDVTTLSGAVLSGPINTIIPPQVASWSLRSWLMVGGGCVVLGSILMVLLMQGFTGPEIATAAPSPASTPTTQQLAASLAASSPSNVEATSQAAEKLSQATVEFVTKNNQPATVFAYLNESPKPVKLGEAPLTRSFDLHTKLKAFFVNKAGIRSEEQIYKLDNPVTIVIEAKFSKAIAPVTPVNPVVTPKKCGLDDIKCQ